MNLVGGDGEFIAFRNCAVASAEHAQEARAAFVDDFAADFRGVLLTGDAPAQVHVHEMNAAREQLLAQPREDKAH